MNGAVWHPLLRGALIIRKEAYVRGCWQTIHVTNLDHPWCGQTVQIPGEQQCERELRIDLPKAICKLRCIEGTWHLDTILDGKKAIIVRKELGCGPCGPEVRPRDIA